MWLYYMIVWRGKTYPVTNDYNASRGRAIGTKMCLHDPLSARDTFSENPNFHEICILVNFSVRRLYDASIPNPEYATIEEVHLFLSCPSYLGPPPCRSPVGSLGGLACLLFMRDLVRTYVHMYVYTCMLFFSRSTCCSLVYGCTAVGDTR